MIRVTIVMLMISLSFYSCNSSDKTTVDKPAVSIDNPEEIEKVKMTVMLYDSLLAKGYRSLDMKTLAEAATEERVTKAFYHMAALGESGVKMDSTLQDIKFLDIKVVSPDKAEVITDEKWDYTYINIESDKQVYDNSVEYKLRYNMVKMDKRWLVEDIKVEYSKENKSEKYIPFQKSSKPEASEENTKGQSEQ